MPPVYPRNDDLLSISLNAKRRYRAGDTITGSITRSAHFIDSDSTLSIRFLGRTKVKIFVSRGQSNSQYRSRYIFWNSRNPPASATLYRGPVHIPPNSQESHSWPFSLTIPTGIPAETIYQGESDSTFLKPGDPETIQLPGSFIFDDNSFWGANAEAYVDYHLEAVLQDSKGRNYEAVLPIHIDGISSPFPITDFGLRTYRGKMMSLSTHRLNPALAQVKLTFGQKAQEVYGSSKVPVLAFQITANTPSVLQIDNPNLIPFQVQGSIIEDRTSEAIRGLKHTLIITRFILRITENCKVLAPGNFNSYDENGEVCWIIKEYLHSGPQKAIESPVPIPLGGNAHDDSSIKECSKPDREKHQTVHSPPDAYTLILPMDGAPFPLDLGQALQIRLPGVLQQKRVAPSFKTFNIHNTHTLDWEMQIDAAGRDAIFRGRHAIQVMGASEESLPTYQLSEESQPST